MSAQPRPTLHWSPRSPFVRKVMIAAHELGLVEQIALVRTVVRMGQPNHDLLPDNPLSKIPTLVLPDGSTIFDSLTICEYLDAQAGGGRLLPPAGPARWVALTRHALGNGYLDLLILWRNERDKPAERQTQEWLDSFATKSQATLARLERDAPDLGATPFDLGHIALGCALSYLDFRFADLDWRAGRPALAAWHEGFAARPSVLATGIVDD
ncbi:glutathione S-transferase family protein [Roseomonas marmotae]|uniref:Glutathione S-transferase family protein n=1 Tax=Roseomonas marmotae TaxID=2768161 RepID=A0ABS3KHB8_9PROT|nr:glutathione S-transferase family protein [Roseomonas marmotae]MBO1076849.1 glutathione S-transferase family protein [Roseomonas marmotae]QTI81186.1 glutathione S-transferase family protein [Roseomonas marmotae]